MFLAVVATATVAVGWGAAPALSGRPQVADPVEFEVRDAPAAAVVAPATAGPRTMLSRAIRPGRRFNLVGLRWSGAAAEALHVRVRRDGGRWGAWSAVGADADHAPDAGGGEGSRARRISDPVWAGHADQVQYRLRARGPVRGVRLHFVNTTGTATRLARLRTGVRSVIGGAVTAAVGLFGIEPARAGGGPPAIVPREQWEGGKCPPRTAPSYGTVQAAFVHHTVTAANYGPGDAAAMVLGVCRYHRNSNGWNDIGYNFLADRFGVLYEGRAGGIDQPVIGAQAQGYNSQSTSVANLGTFSSVGQTDAALRSIAKLLAWKLSLQGVPVTGKATLTSSGGSLNRYPAGARVRLDRIAGHGDADATSCPGDGLRAQLPRLRTLAAAVLIAPATRLSLVAVRSRISYGQKAELTGSLADPAGTPLPARDVEIQLRGRRGWSTIQTARTGTSGEFRTRVRIAYNRALRARFAGDAAAGGVHSQATEVGVRALVSASLSPAAAAVVPAGSRVALRGTVRPSKRSALLLAYRLRGDTYRRIARVPVRVRRGRVTARFRLARAGSYRLRLAVLADARNLGGRSPYLEARAAGGATASGR